MKALFVGVGSIGKRHIKNFYAECMKHNVLPNIHVLRREIGDLEYLKRFVNQQVTELTDDDYDVAFITNPTYLHYDALLKCKERVKWYFVEKPIFDGIGYDLEKLGINNNNTYVAAPMRHTMVYKKLKEIINSNKVFSLRVICSSYLPNWRKDVDYRKVYSSDKRMGGGVNLDLIHEIDYIYDLLGEPKNILSISGKFSDLEISSNDLSTYILEYNNKICEVHLDYFGRKSVRMCEVFTHDGCYIADFINEKLILPDSKEIDCHVMEDEEYVNEMSYFYSFISGDADSMNTPEVALKTLNIALKGDKEYGE